jgi:phosphatidylinositol alpha 1,6-mannosyltransferase
MTDNRLFEALTRFDSQEAQALFGAELTVESRDNNDLLTPIKRVAIFAESFLPKLDGVSKTAFLTLRHLQQTGREVLVFAPDTAPDRVGSSQIIRLPSFGLPIAPETRVALPSLSISGYLDQFKPDLIQLFSPTVLSAGGILAARRRTIPIIATYQTDLPMYTHHYGFDVLAEPTRNWLRFIHNSCHLTLVPSTYTLNQLRAGGFHRLRRWARGVDGERFNPAKRSAEWRSRLLNGRDPDSLLCIYVGRLAHEKRVDLLLTIARTPGVALTIIGDGALRDELEAQFAGTDTCFMGYLYGEALAQAYASADVFTFTGACETFGQVVQEAMASGLPAVVINQGGVVDLVQDGETGYICAPDAEAFASAVRTLRDDPALLKQMSGKARRCAEAHPWSAIMQQLESHYCEAIRLNDRHKRFYHNSGFTLSLPSFFQWSK